MAPSTNHGGHELFDAHEVIASVISLMDQYQMYEQHIQDQKLKDILNRQYAFIETMYNTIVESFSTGNKPSVSTQVYKMEEDHTTVYGLNQGEPKKPNQSVQELSDKGLSAYMLGQTKSLATLFSMTALEMTNPVLRRVIADSVPNLIEMSYEIFLYQNKHGYYQVPQLNPQDMNQMLQSYVQTNQKPMQ
ncbi:MULTISPECIES: spore coat protein [Pontibacillus]|uniref:Spore coat protein n=1 Tax=Pontibacillus chungwhensis TaxID=265426 RepID=A0ABY8V5S9_9BACI|nr:MULTISPECIES: spore coat protein [Pontibacillus]MCD5323163.1 spore coat protein [Pontibacillus sp. HN14]WIG00200.1 spore coat protein [Pontibacillus chungwhensis]